MNSGVSHSLEAVAKYQSSVMGDREREGQGIWNRVRMRQQEGLIWSWAAEPRSSRGSKAMFFNPKNNGAVAMLSRSVLSDSFQHHGLQSARLLCSWGFSGQKYWRGLPCPPPGYLPRDWTQVFYIAGRFFSIWATMGSHQNALGRRLERWSDFHVKYTYFAIIISTLWIIGGSQAFKTEISFLFYFINARTLNMRSTILTHFQFTIHYCWL